MTDLVPATAGAIITDLGAAGDPDRAAGQRAYLKSDRVHLGCTVPTVRRIVTGQLRAVAPGGKLTREEAFALAEELWPAAATGPRPASGPDAPARSQVFEHCLAAVEVLVMQRNRLTPSDLPGLEPYVHDARTWALVDPLATQVAGEVVAAAPGPAADALLERWCHDADFWLRRSGLLAELRPLASGQPFDRFARHADQMLDEREFFIRKAIGWVLRETGKRRPADVIGYVLPRASRLSGVTWREVIRRLPPDAVAQLEAARSGQGAVP